MEIKQAQKLVGEHLEKIGYTKVETDVKHVFLHLLEEVGELARTLLHKETKRDSLPFTTKPSELSDELADIFWQTIKLALYLKIDLESCFINKLEKNRKKPKNT
jgi:NTP pyrophosphatase (non-canonical NTP hydrolase)